MNKFPSLDLLNKEIASIQKAGAKLNSRIQDAAVSVLYHFNENHDIRVVNRLVNDLFGALSKGARKSAMTSWLLANCAVSANTDAATKKEKPFVYDKNKTTSPEMGMAKAWYDHKPDPKPDEVFDLQKAVKALLARASKAETLKGDASALHAIAAAVGIPDSDVTTKHDVVTEQETTEQA